MIDGGRDSRGASVVTAAEGTGIVHTAPGCGDVDHQLGEQHGLPTVAPLDEAGRFTDGFGEFTGMAAYEPETADLVLTRLKETGFHVADERYPHVYPHCWRTGEELIFRLVDEWLIRMDWREEIKAVVRTIDWRPESIGGERRELEWLDNMRDWMVSKKRFWGLALPIWANPDDPAEFEVIGSLDELEERAVDGWTDELRVNPHRPLIDAVTVRGNSGATLRRVLDVGNPWLDAGITPFSTTGYNVDRDAWEALYPFDLVSESFPGQFRNWFYSLLALGTMMRHEEPTPEQKRPFRTLFGYKLVLDEAGRPMHKSDGTAIWFEEAAEQLGVDTMRWMYLAADPAKDLRFGTRHADRPVPLDTPEGRSRRRGGVRHLRGDQRPGGRDPAAGAHPAVALPHLLHGVRPRRRVRPAGRTGPGGGPAGDRPLAAGPVAGDGGGVRRRLRGLPPGRRLRRGGAVRRRSVELVHPPQPPALLARRRGGRRGQGRGLPDAARGPHDALEAAGPGASVPVRADVRGPGHVLG